VGPALKVAGTRSGDLKGYTLAVAKFWAFDDRFDKAYQLGEATGREAVLHHGSLCGQLRRMRQVHCVATTAGSVVGTFWLDAVGGWIRNVDGFCFEVL
jgi:hypothetical protein